MAAGAVKIGITTLIFLSALNSKAETVKCLIKLAGLKIGTLIAQHEKVKEMDCYYMVSDVEISFLFKIKIYYKTVSIYKNDELINSKVSSIVGNSNYTSNTYWDGKKYIINCNTYKYSYYDTSITEPIKWSVSKLYFQRPKADDCVYAETYGKLSKLKTEYNALLFEIPKSKQRYYYNAEGLFTKVEMINSIKNFEVVKNAN